MDQIRKSIEKRKRAEFVARTKEQKKRKKETEMSPDKEKPLRQRARMMIEESLITAYKANAAFFSAEGDPNRYEVRSAVDLGVEIENEIFSLSKEKVTSDYTNRCRNIAFNLRLEGNSQLQRNLLLGELSCGKLVRMSNQELAPPEIQASDAAVQKKKKEEVIVKLEDSAIPTENYKCQGCSSSNCSYFSTSGSLDVRKAEIWGSKDTEEKVELYCRDCKLRWSENVQ